MRRLEILCVLCGALGCQPNIVDCGVGGSFLIVDGEAFCAYDTPTDGSPVDCPDELPQQAMLGDQTICSEAMDQPGEFPPGLCLALGQTGCRGDDAGPIDAGGNDGDGGIDAGSLDSGSPNEDSGLDGGSALDGGRDAGSIADAGPEPDGGVDAGPNDAGRDAGPQIDAGPPPSCTVLLADDFEHPDGDLSGRLLDVPSATAWSRGSPSNRMDVVGGRTIAIADSTFSSIYDADQGAPLAYEGLRVRMSLRFPDVGARLTNLFFNSQASSTDQRGMRLRFWPQNGELAVYEFDGGAWQLRAQRLGLQGALSVDTDYFVELQLDDTGSSGTVTLATSNYASEGGDVIAFAPVSGVVGAVAGNDTKVNLWATPQPGAISQLMNEFEIASCAAPPPIACLTPETLDDTLAAPAHLSVGDDGLLYVVDRPSPDSIVRLAPDGTSRGLVAGGLDVKQPVAIYDGFVYFTDESGGTVQRVPSGGGAIETLITGRDRPLYPAAGDGFVYWADGASRGSASMQRMPVGGGAVEPLITGGDGPVHLLLVADQLYYTEVFQGSAHRIAADGSGGPNLLMDAVELGGDIAVDGTDVYFVTHGNGGRGLHATQTDGSGDSTLVGGLAAEPGQVVVTESHVYYVDARTTSSARIRRVPRSGPFIPEDVATGDRVLGMETDGTYLYWVEHGAGLLRRMRHCP